MRKRIVKHTLTPRLAIAHPSLFTAMEIELYEEQVLRNPRATERDASRFFSQFPKFLFLGQGEELRREVSLFNSSGEPIGRVDFFRRSYGRRDWDIVELKSPAESVVVNQFGKHPRLTSSIYKGIEQARDYRDLIREDCTLRANLMQRGILVYCPQILVVAGREGQEVPPELMALLYDRIHQQGIEIRSYSDIYQFAKAHYEANQVIIVFGQIGQSWEEVTHDLLGANQNRQRPRTILFVENDVNFLHVRTEFLREEYDVIMATHPEEALQILSRTHVDLIILGLRLIDDNDTQDISGLVLAQNDLYCHIPKIMLIGFPSYEIVREALTPRLEGLPPVIDFVAKAEGSEAMLRSIKKAFDVYVLPA